MLFHLIGFSFIAGWLFPLRSLPIFSFSQEWAVSAILLFIVLYAFFKNKCRNSKQKNQRIPYITFLFAALPFMGLLQIALGTHPLPIGVGFFICAFFAFFFAAQLGLEIADNGKQSTSEKINFNDGTTIIFKWMLWGGLLSATIVFIQLLDWDTYLFPLVRSPSLAESRPSANLSQPNLMTLHLVISLISAGFLYIEKKQSSILLGSIAIFLVLAIVFANTRAYLLMLLPIAVSVAIYKGPKKRILLCWILFILPGIYLALAPFHPELMEILGHQGRRAFDVVPASDARVKIWLASIDILKSHPWLGVGLGAYSVGFFEAAKGSLGSVGATGNAHNLTLQLMAECGILFGVAFSLALVWWFLSRVFQKKQAPWEIASICIVGAALAHSLVEFPLWFFSFLIPIAFFSGLLSSNASFSFEGAPKRIISFLRGLFFILAAAALLWSVADFFDLQDNYENGITIGNEATIKKIASQDKFSLFQWHYDYGRFLTTELNGANSAEVMALARSSVRRFPFVRGLARYAYISAETNNLTDAVDALTVLNRMYPKPFRVFLNQNILLCSEDNLLNSSHCKLANIGNDILLKNSG